VQICPKRQIKSIKRVSNYFFQLNQLFVFQRSEFSFPFLVWKRATMNNTITIVGYVGQNLHVISFGVAHARCKGTKSGKAIGRPSFNQIERVKLLLHDGLSIREIARALGISKTTVMKTKNRSELTHRALDAGALFDEAVFGRENSGAEEIRVHA